MLSKLLKQYKSHNLIQPFSQQINSKLKFDDKGYCLIYRDKDGDNDIKWGVRISLGFTLLNAFLSIAEYTNPIFGGWNQLAFTSCSLIGSGALVALNIISKRVVNEVKINREGNQLEILYQNAFWKPLSENYFISEFANLQPSYANFYRSELINQGKIWINFERNYYYGLKQHNEALLESLNGQKINFGKMHITALKYKKYQ